MMPQISYEGSEASTILVHLAETYSQCLDLTKSYADEKLEETGKDELDLDMLQNFLEVRAELFKSAEDSLAALALQQDENDPQRDLLTGRAVSILEEMTEVEARLTDFLSGHLDKMKKTIGQMRKSQTVFKRYSHLGGPVQPSRITRHE